MAVGSITATWTDPTGVQWELSNTADTLGWFTVPGPSGWHATTYEIVTDPVPRGGENVRFIRSKPARLVWPVYTYGDTHLAYTARRRQIQRAFTMTLHRRSVGTLRVIRPDNSAREIDCFYESGLEGEAGEGWLFSKDAVNLFCPDGYWRDTTPQSIIRAYVPGVDFLNPFPTVSDSLTLGETQVDNIGDVDAWPTWTLTGPMTAVTATNVTTGYEWTLTTPVLAGEQVTVTTFQPSVRGAAGENLVNALDWPNAYLWWLAPDTNDLIINVTGGGVGTSVQMDFYPRYEGA